MMASSTKSLLMIALIVSSCNAFQPTTPIAHTHHKTPTTSLQMGIFDDLKLIFSEEGQKNRAEYIEREKEEQMEAQRLIMERRTNPTKMAEYMDTVETNRGKLQEERSVYDFQTKNGGEGYDPLDEWKRLKKEGKVKSQSDLERDEGSRRLGSEGLVEVRTDERLPYIDQGWVDESDESGGGGWFGGLFGGDKKE
mmetsp:Transcript_20781/g.30605  ORF Transcript_20781/g.30605 Transcript_20781/m.30605 type:complete len:195 (+) Transcript_20781:161-745(+)